MFLKLTTHSAGDRLLVNTDHVKSIGPMTSDRYNAKRKQGGSWLMIVGDSSSTQVCETVEEIEKMMTTSLTMPAMSPEELASIKETFLTSRQIGDLKISQPA